MFVGFGPASKYSGWSKSDFYSSNNIYIYMYNYIYREMRLKVPGSRENEPTFIQVCSQTAKSSLEIGCSCSIIQSHQLIHLFWIDLPPLGAFRYCWAALAALGLLGLLGWGSWGAQAPLDLGQRSGDWWSGDSWGVWGIDSDFVGTQKNPSIN